MRNVSQLVVCRFASLTCAWTVASMTLAVCASSAHAQTTDAIGIRAQGMAGAFTAVADDASAGFWNPAGLAGGPFANGTVEYGKPDRSSGETLRGFAAAYPALGVTYYRFPLSQIRLTASSTGGLPASRKEDSTLSLYGATVGQSLGEHLVVGTTLKLLHVSDNDTAADLDVGVMASFGPARIGATLRNVAAPSFGAGSDTFELARHARAGFALTSGRRGVVGSATLAVDMDLTREPGIFTGTGEERFLSVGGEAWAPHNTIGVRGGFRRNTVGAKETLASGGVSVAVRQSTFAEFYMTTGDLVRHGWGIGLRLTF